MRLIAILVAVAALAISAGAAAHASDVYKNYKYRLKFDGRIVAGFSKANGLKPTRKFMRSHHDAVTLERGLTHDTQFEQWASAFTSPGNDLFLPGQKKDLVIEALNEAGQVSHSYLLVHCWASAYQAQPDLDANGNAVAILHMKIENEGVELQN